jgi:hypothetical protein
MYKMDKEQTNQKVQSEQTDQTDQKVQIDETTTKLNVVSSNFLGKKKPKRIVKEPKTIEQSERFLNLILSHTEEEFYQINFIDDEIKLFYENQELSDRDLANKESLILASFINEYYTNFSTKYTRLINEIAKPILYVFLLPIVSDKDSYIIKVGYTIDLIKRYSELKKEFGIEELKLIYCHLIDGEHTELNIHKNLEKTFNSSVYRMIKKKKIENSSISEETYIFSWLLFRNIYNIIYRDYIMEEKIILITKETELKKIELELKKTDLELKKTELELKKLDLSKSNNDLEIKKIELRKSDNEIELKKIELELKKLDFDKLSL